MNDVYGELDVNKRWSRTVMQKVETYIDLNYARDYKKQSMEGFSHNTVVNARVLLEMHHNRACPLKFTQEEVSEIEKAAGLED